MRRFEKFPADKRTGVIAFEALGPADQIVIRTQGSQYHFLIVDPASRHGILSSDKVGDSPREAVLVGMLAPEGIDFSSDASGLKTQNRALFYLKANSGLQPLVTSSIRELAYIRCASKRRAVAA